MKISKQQLKKMISEECKKYMYYSKARKPKKILIFRNKKYKKLIKINEATSKDALASALFWSEKTIKDELEKIRANHLYKFKFLKQYRLSFERYNNMKEEKKKTLEYFIKMIDKRYDDLVLAKGGQQTGRPGSEETEKNQEKKAAEEYFAKKPKNFEFNPSDPVEVKHANVLARAHPGSHYSSVRDIRDQEERVTKKTATPEDLAIVDADKEYTRKSAEQIRISEELKIYFKWFEHWFGETPPQENWKDPDPSMSNKIAQNIVNAKISEFNNEWQEDQEKIITALSNQAMVLGSDSELGAP